MRNTHCRTWDIARNLKNMENETKHCITCNRAKNTEKLKK